MEIIRTVPLNRDGFALSVSGLAVIHVSHEVPVAARFAVARYLLRAVRSTSSAYSIASVGRGKAGQLPPPTGPRVFKRATLIPAARPGTDRAAQRVSAVSPSRVPVQR